MRIRSAVVYSVLRLLAFLVPFGIMMLIPIMRDFYWLSAIFAALIGLSLSMLLLHRPLENLTSEIAARRGALRGSAPTRGARADADAEDAAADAASAD
ncbi:MAG: DUF4229 domain-containing protein [Microbacterium sp.]